ncbi:acyltransferase [Luteibacter pinisoli]|uniref:Acyltransferase n=1 Tax=Luteibacter pinisoli TaxID=2589080 RepID=A0A4Y5Z1X0_9GAMM|nr:acyltransferase [Luteibacter pinisoli]QDE38488.1 acyltransferase [Luteibacter pinisoli]
MQVEPLKMPARRKDTGLDGLRGLAALAVVFSHAMFGYFPFTHTGAAADLRETWEPGLFNSPLYILYSGGFAVSLFFVLSGYVLAKRFFEGADIDYLRGSAIKRYFRLGVPVAAAVMFGYLLMAAHAFHTVSPELPHSFVWDSYRGPHSFVQALNEAVYGSLLLGHTSYDYVLWTIQLEFYGSMLLFAFLALFGRFRYSGLAAAAAALLLWHISSNPGTYFAMFIVGAYIGRLPALFRTRWFAAIAIPLGIFVASYKSNAPLYVPLVVLANWIQEHAGLSWNWPALYELLGAWLLVAGVVASPLAHTILTARPVAWLGRVSFTVYLIHTLILGSAGAAVFKAVARHASYSTAAWSAIAVVVILTLILAEPFRRIFDEGAIRLANRVGKWATRESQSARDRAIVAPTEATTQ